MKAPSISLQSLLDMLMGLSPDNRRWLAEHLVETQPKASARAKSKAKAKEEVDASNFNEYEAESWEHLGFTPESAASLARGMNDVREGRYAFRGTAEEMIKHYA